MPLTINNETYLMAAEAAHELGIVRQTFDNYRSQKGDAWIKAYDDLIPGRKFYRLRDVVRLREERS